MTKFKETVFRFANESSDILIKMMIISFIFLLIQLSLTSIFLFLEPKLYVGFHGFSIRRNIFVFLTINVLVFLVSLVFLVLSKYKK